jgi:peptidoglycan/LPS O-acetylase OafA/YrhL
MSAHTADTVRRSRTTTGPTPADCAPAPRVDWLDGVRALAAVFVVLHHTWLMTVGGYPDNTGPWYTDWMVYGHLAVSVFIVVSGYSLGLSPARHGLRLKGGGWVFLRRRFWRIVPPYWAALILATLLIAVGWITPIEGEPFEAKDFAVYALLLQDAVGATTPNGAFWSIAVEWHIYFLFPLVVLFWRQCGIMPVLAVVALLVVIQHVIGYWVPVIALFDRFSPAYLVLFILGGTAAVLVQRGIGSSLALIIGAVLFIIVGGSMALLGSEPIVHSYFWVDLAVGTSTAALFVALGQGRLRFVARVLSAGFLTRTGEFAFSIYLVHAPILAVLVNALIVPAGLDRMSSMLLLLVTGVPASLCAAYTFFLAFERPFLRIRSFRDLVAALRSGGSRRRRQNSSAIRRRPRATVAPDAVPVLPGPEARP